MAINKSMAALAAGLAGSLALAACGTLEEAAVEAVAATQNATLTGAEVVTSAGDSDGYAQGELSVSDELDQICYDVNKIRNLDPITSVTINRATRGRVGPAIIRADRANEGGWKNCVSKAEWLETSFDKAPSAYYMQISTTRYPNGAIRGQFRR